MRMGGRGGSAIQCRHRQRGANLLGRGGRPDRYSTHRRKVVRQQAKPFNDFAYCNASPMRQVPESICSRVVELSLQIANAAEAGDLRARRGVYLLLSTLYWIRLGNPDPFLIQTPADFTRGPCMVFDETNKNQKWQRTRRSVAKLAP
jgi:hypothetical protein